MQTGTIPGEQVTRSHDNLKSKYAIVKQRCQGDWSSDQASNAILELILLSLDFLNAECTPVDLISKVPGKTYIAYCRRNTPDVFSRATNSALFTADRDHIKDNWNLWLEGDTSPDDAAEIAYTAAIAPCLAMELFDRQNKKGPATYFECLIGHIFAKTLQVDPERATTFEIEGRHVRMTMDFLFHVSNDVRIHLPVKMSTRERVVQAWSHQRLLGSAYGDGVYRGVMVLFSETKLDSRKHEVVEICVPDQWLAYQVLLAEMDRIYYFDMPARYRALTTEFPNVITIKEFAEFFSETEALL